MHRETDPAVKDLDYRPACGCCVTFFAASGYRTSRMLPGEGCPHHVGQHNAIERDALLERARQYRDRQLAVLNSPNN